MIEELRQRSSEIEDLCRQFGVKRLEIFGSAVTGKIRPDSDLDFIVEFASEGPGFAKRYFGLLAALENLFGRSIDLVMEDGITNPYFRESLDETRTELYAA